jgi:hypothetical protein
VSHPATGVYCVRNSGFRPKVAIGSGSAPVRITSLMPTAFEPADFDTIVSASVLADPLPEVGPTICDTWSGPGGVRVYVYQTGGDEAAAGFVDRWFHILLKG